MGNASSELQHIANALSGLSGEESKFLEAVYNGKILVSMKHLNSNAFGIERVASLQAPCSLTSS
jgi:hypothetical protein